MTLLAFPSPIAFEKASRRRPFLMLHDLEMPVKYEASLKNFQSTSIWIYFQSTSPWKYFQSSSTLQMHSKLGLLPRHNCFFCFRYIP